MEKTKPKMRKGIRRWFRPNGTGRRITTLFMSLVLVLSLVAPMLPAMEVQAGTTTYTNLIPTSTDNATALAAKAVKFNGMDWYIIADNSTAVDAGSVTLLAKDPIAVSKFDESGESNAYGSSTVKAYLDGLTTGTGSFAGVASAIKSVDLTINQYNSTTINETITGARLYLLSIEEARALPQDVGKCNEADGAYANYWWLRSPGKSANREATVDGSDGLTYKDGPACNLELEVRPALQLDLAKVVFSSESKTFTLKITYSNFVGTTTTVKFNGMDWYIIADNSTAVDAGSVTLLAKECISASKFGDTNNSYSASTVKSYLDGLTRGSGSFAAVADTIKSVKLTDVGVTGAKLYLLSVSEANVLPYNVRKCSQATGASINYWWLRTAGTRGTGTNCAANVAGLENAVDAEGYNISTVLGIRPALQLDLSAVDFDSETKEFTKASVATPKFSPAAGTYDSEQSVTISTDTTGATIYYTTDGTTPTTSSTKYTAAITVDETKTIKAIAVKDGMTDSAVASATYTISTTVEEQVKTPEFSPAAGSYDSAQSVTISTDTEGATIYYTTIGTPTTSSTKYTGAIDVEKTMTIRAIAVKEGMADSEVVSAKYTITTPNAYGDHLNGLIEFNNKFWYLIEDNSVGENSGSVTLLAKEYIGYSRFDNDSNIYADSDVKAYLESYYEEYFTSVDEAVKNTDLGKLYLLNYSKAKKLPDDMRKCSEITGMSYNGWWLSDRADRSTTNAMCVDGNNGFVTTSGESMYAGLGVRPVLRLNLAAVTFLPSLNKFILNQVKTPSISPAEGTYDSAQSVTISTDTAGAAIYYTTDGTTPTTSSTKYTGAISVDATTTIKAIAVKDGMTDSEVASAKYTISTPTMISYDVTFKVVYGSWDDGTTKAQTVNLTGAEGDTLNLTAAQIPAVGKKPADGYKAGSWDVTPSTDTAITKDTVYTYTYSKEEEVPKVNVTGVTLNKTALELTEGTTGTLTAEVAPDDATDMTVTWKSDATGVATVDNSGVVTAVKAGTATITVTATNGTDDTADDKTATCKVTVKEEEVPKVNVTGVTLNKTALELTEGTTGTLKAEVAPKDATDTTVTWESGDTTVATVDSSGVVTAVKAGTATITVTATNGTDDTTDDKTASCEVTVTAATEPKTDITGVTLDKAELTVEEGKTEALAATVAPEDASSKDVIWSSSDDTVATIDADGVVVAVKAGTATITVTATNGTEDTADDKTATCEVTVTEAAAKTDITGITLDKTTVSLEVEQTETLTVTVEPEEATDKNVTFKSSDEKIATVDEEGKITAVAEGSTVIIVTADNGTAEAEDDKTATCIVTVTAKKTSSEIPEEGPALVKDIFGKTIYYKDGEAQKDYNGLVNVDGIWYYVENGVLLETKTGFVMYEDGLFLVVEGKLETGKSGLVQDPYNSDIWYFLADGQVQTQYTGLALYDGEWFYVNKGRLDTTIAAYIEYDGGLFYVAAGRILKEVSGLAQDPNGPDWYFLAEGQAQTQYTGLAMYDGEWFYVVDGKLAEDYTGTVEYDGSEFNVVNGMVK